MDQEIARQAHKEIVNLFFPQEESEESDESRTEEKSDKSGKCITFVSCQLTFNVSLFPSPKTRSTTRWRIYDYSTANIIWDGYILQYPACRGSLASSHTVG